jgi:hypothetical protein
VPGFPQFSLNNTVLVESMGKEADPTWLWQPELTNAYVTVVTKDSWSCEAPPC